jgi:hypothetical protein
LNKQGSQKKFNPMPKITDQQSSLLQPLPRWSPFWQSLCSLGVEGLLAGGRHNRFPPDELQNR